MRRGGDVQRPEVTRVLPGPRGGAEERPAGQDRCSPVKNDSGRRVEKSATSATSSA
jgi:hypothetical protein